MQVRNGESDNKTPVGQSLTRTTSLDTVQRVHACTGHMRYKSDNGHITLGEVYHTQ